MNPERRARLLEVTEKAVATETKERELLTRVIKEWALSNPSSLLSDGYRNNILSDEEAECLNNQWNEDPGRRTLMCTEIFQTLFPDLSGIAIAVSVEHYYPNNTRTVENSNEIKHHALVRAFPHISLARRVQRSRDNGPVNYLKGL